MGTKMAPPHPTLIMGYVEENLYEIIGKRYSIKTEFIRSWKRYAYICLCAYTYVHTRVCMYIYINIVIHRQTVSFY